jgi:G3E family GTPase
MVTVVDAANFLTHYEGSETLLDREIALGEGDERSISDLFADQVEFADVIVINKTDLVGAEELAELRAILRTLNPEATIIDAERGRAPLDQLLDTGLFDMEKAQASAGWLRELNNEHTPETEEYGIGSFVFRARRPFHPKRYWDFIHTEWGGLLRSKGYFWLATRHDIVGLWSQAGGSAEYRPVAQWWAAAPEGSLPEEEESRMEITREWREPYGDRRQELVFIGQDLPREKMLEELEQCLLTDEEMEAGPNGWKLLLEDPFPGWTAPEAQGEGQGDPV